MADQHVYPHWQGYRHDLQSRYCHCRPEYQLANEEERRMATPPADVPCVVIHHIVAEEALRHITELEQENDQFLLRQCYTGG